MIHSVRSYRGSVTAPHHLAAQAGLDVLKDGGNAVEASVAVAACLAVVYPHMTGIGGDGFWLIAEADGRCHAIHGCGSAAAAANLELYEGSTQIPTRGPLAANTVAGAVSAWEAALASSGGEIPLQRLLRDAVHHAEHGVAVTRGGAEVAATKGAELRGLPGAYAGIYERAGRPLREGDRLRQPELARTLTRLAQDGLAGFYTGALAQDIVADLAAVGSPVGADDLAAHRAERPPLLRARVTGADLYNTGPPTQGFASLMILALFDRITTDAPDAFGHVHGLVEATKRAFLLRDTLIQDPARIERDLQALLDDGTWLDRLGATIDPKRALPWPRPSAAGDTTWFATADDEGRVVSAIQSTYFEFGSGVVLPRTGITWQNRGSSFRLVKDGWNALRPGAKPFHTLNPALARFADGRVMAHGTMGGEGQPQTQAAVFTRYARFGSGLQQAIAAPRWLLGRTWGEDSTTLKIEQGFHPSLYEQLSAAGHAVERVPAFSTVMGHAGAIVRHPDGLLEGATDPRSDGQAAAW
jgi:gamma-glutamyltranspeptidase/glutathione hydrolase